MDRLENDAPVLRFQVVFFLLLLCLVFFSSHSSGFPFLYLIHHHVPFSSGYLPFLINGYFMKDFWTRLISSLSFVVSFPYFSFVAFLLFCLSLLSLFSFGRLISRGKKRAQSCIQGRLGWDELGSRPFREIHVSSIIVCLPGRNKSHWLPALAIFFLLCILSLASGRPFISLFLGSLLCVSPKKSLHQTHVREMDLLKQEERWMWCILMHPGRSNCGFGDSMCRIMRGRRSVVRYWAAVRAEWERTLRRVE